MFITQTYTEIQVEGFVRQVVFLTDGSVSNEDQLFKHIAHTLGDSRLFTVGIGSAPNRYFMRRAADIGKGTYTFISSAHDVQPKMQQLFDKLAHPAMTNLALTNKNGESLDFWPSSRIFGFKCNNATNCVRTM